MKRQVVAVAEILMVSAAATAMLGLIILVFAAVQWLNAADFSAVQSITNFCIYCWAVCLAVIKWNSK